MARRSMVRFAVPFALVAGLCAAAYAGRGGGGGGHFGGGGGGHFGGGMSMGHMAGGMHPGYAATRPMGGEFNRGAEFNRGNLGASRFGEVNRGEFNRGNINNFNRGELNRGNINNFNNFNRGEFNRNPTFNRNINNFNNFNHLNPANRGWYNPYSAYHSGWVHGYWNGHYGGYGWGSGLGYRGWGYGGWGYPGWGYSGFYGGGWWPWAAGLSAVGLAAWALGPSIYSWGYSPYYNPYYVQPIVVQQPLGGSASYGPNQPIDFSSTAPDQSQTQSGEQAFEQARGAFQQGDYPGALELTNSALNVLPNDVEIRQFRALVFFALGQYERSASDLYSVLSVGPGWDWTTLAGLYGGGIEAYTSQLRALEGYCGTNARSAPARFVLAYHYMTQGHAEAAARQFSQAAKLQPQDQLAAKLAQLLNKPEKPASDTPPALPAPPEEDAKKRDGKIAGVWSAKPAQGVEITLTVGDDNKFSWKVTQQGSPREFKGESSYANHILTLTQSAGPAMVGELTWKDDNSFNFKVPGNAAGDPGLEFTRSR